jgi:hypothetical protein
MVLIDDFAEFLQFLEINIEMKGFVARISVKQRQNPVFLYL